MEQVWIQQVISIFNQVLAYNDANTDGVVTVQR